MRQSKTCGEPCAVCDGCLEAHDAVLKARVAELEAAVALAAKTFRQYQDIHILKFLSRQVVQGDTNLTQEDQNNLAKSKRNMDLAEAMEQALAGRKDG